MTYRKVFPSLLTILLLIGAFPVPVAADVMLRSEVLVPVGDSTRWFTPGFGVGFEASRSLAWEGWSLQGGLGAQVLPAQAPVEALVAFARTGVTWEYTFSPGWTLGMNTTAGLFTAARSDLGTRDTKALVGAGTVVRWILEPTLSLRAGIEYLRAEGLYQTAAFWLGLNLTEASR